MVHPARANLGKLSDLNDDSLLKVLLFCDTIDLLRIEQSCHYFKDLASHREVWYAVLLRLPRGCIPPIMPFHTRGESDYRDLAIKAVRSQRHWTTEEAKPTWRSKLTLKHSDRNVSDMQLLPGGRHFIYFYYNTLYCFDVSRNAYILEHIGGLAEYISSTYVVKQDGETVNMTIVSRNSDDSMAIQLSIVKFSLKSGQCKPIGTVAMDWDMLCSAVGGEYVMFRRPSMNEDYILIPYHTGTFDSSSQKRGAILFDYSNHLAVILSVERNIDTSFKSTNLPMHITKNHVLYLSNHGTQALAIHSVPFSQFKGYWRDSSNISEWITYNVPLEHEKAHYTFDFPSSALPEYVIMSISLSNWLDREKEQLTNHDMVSLSLVDICFVHKATGDDPLSFLNGKRRMEYHHLRFVELAENSSSGNYEHQSGMFTHKESSIFEELGGQVIASHMPSRHGRLVTHTGKDQGPLRSEAISLHEDGKAHASTLKHLDGKFVRDLVMDYYTGTIIYSTSPQDPVTLKSLKEATEHVVEGFD